MTALVDLGDAAIAIWQAAGWVIVHGVVLAAVAAALAATALRRARPAVLAALWSIVLVKFLVPIGPALPWSLSSAIDAVFGGGAPAAGPYMLPAASAPAVAAPAAALTAWHVVALVGLAAWGAGAAAIVWRRVREHRALRRRALAARPATPELVALVAAAAHRLGLARAPEVRIEDGGVPWVIGLGRAVLVLPAAVATGPRAALVAVVGHELAHLRRRDAWLRLVQVAAGAVFFFVPVVRWVNRRIDAARELACDAWAVERGPLAAHDYARVLVALVRDRAAAAAPAASLALAAHPHLLGRRVDALIARRRPLRAGIGAPGLALLAAWGVIALGGASRAEPAGASRHDECQFSPDVAARILSVHPEADADGDGELTRDEACDFQLELGRRAPEVEAVASTVSVSEAPPLVEGLCCNCAGGVELSAPAPAAEPNTCTQD